MKLICMTLAILSCMSLSAFADDINITINGHNNTVIIQQDRSKGSLPVTDTRKVFRAKVARKKVDDCYDSRMAHEQRLASWNAMFSN